MEPNKVSFCELPGLTCDKDVECEKCEHYTIDKEEGHPGFFVDPEVTEVVGLKYDDGKPPIDLVDPHFIASVAKVLGYGAKKYSAYNWTKGIKYSRLYAALQRHLMAFWMGIDDDEESKLPHLWHAATNLMMLCAMGRQWDDRHGV
jgi:hypothetical protein